MRDLNEYESLHLKKFDQAAKEVAAKRGDGMWTFGEVRKLMNPDREIEPIKQEKNHEKS